MRAFSFLIFPTLLGVSLMAQAQVYQSTGEDGSVTFSDQPSPESEEITVPETNVGDSVEVPPPAPNEPKPVVEATPEAPQGELYVKDKDDNNNRRRRRPRPTPHGGGGNGR